MAAWSRINNLCVARTNIATAKVKISAALRMRLVFAALVLKTARWITARSAAVMERLTAMPALQTAMVSLWHQWVSVGREAAEITSLACPDPWRVRLR